MLFTVYISNLATNYYEDAPYKLAYTNFTNINILLLLVNIV